MTSFYTSLLVPLRPAIHISPAHVITEGGVVGWLYSATSLLGATKSFSLHLLIEGKKCDVTKNNMIG